MTKSSKKVVKSENQGEKTGIKISHSESFYFILIGKNPTGFFVTIILCLLIICFTILATKTKLVENNSSMIIGVFSSAIMELIVFFVGSNKSK